MAYKINIRNASNNGWVNLLQAQYVEYDNSSTSTIAATDLQAAFVELYNEKIGRVVNTNAPTVNDDAYQVGTVWVETTNNDAYVLYDNTTGAAVWKKTGNTQEEIEDFVGAMVSGNTENGIAVTYDDVNGKLDFDVNDFDITLSGDVEGTGTVTDLSNVNIATTLSAATMTTLDGRYVNVTGDTMTGALTTTQLTLTSGANADEFSTDGTLAGNSDTAVPTEQAVKTYVDARVSGLDWKESVKDKDLDAPPGSPATGDRYLVSYSPNAATGDWAGHDNEMAEWDGSAWVFESITEGAATWVEDEDVQYVWNGTTWAKIGTTITHNNMLGLQGGNTTERFHLTSAEHTSITGSKTANTVFAAPDGSAGVGGFRTLVATDIPTLDSTKISDFTEAAQDAFGALVTAGTQSNVTVTYDDVNNKVDYVVNTSVSASASSSSNAGVASFDSSQFTVDANGYVQFITASTVDHGGLLGLGDDDHTQYVHISTARTITAQHTFAPTAAQAPFVLGSNAQGEWVEGLNADMVDGHHWNVDATASAPTTTQANDIWVEIV